MTELQMLTTAQYAKQEILAERSPNIGIYQVCDDFHLTDNEGRIFIKGKTYKSRDAAVTDRSKILEKSYKFIGM